MDISSQAEKAAKTKRDRERRIEKERAILEAYDVVFDDNALVKAATGGKTVSKDKSGRRRSKQALQK